MTKNSQIHLRVRHVNLNLKALRCHVKWTFHQVCQSSVYYSLQITVKMFAVRKSTVQLKNNNKIN